MPQIKMPGLKPWARKMVRRGENISKTEVLLARAIVVYDQWVQKNFQADGKLHDSGSLHWKPLSQVTIRMRRKGKRGGGAQILRDTRRLQRDWDRNWNTKQASLKSKVGYSILHERGGETIINKRRVKVPQRKIFPEKKQGQKIIKPVVDDFFKNAIK